MKSTHRIKSPRKVSSNLLNHVVGKKHTVPVKLKDGGVASGAKPISRLDKKPRKSIIDLSNAGTTWKGDTDGDKSPKTSAFSGFKKGGSPKKFIQNMHLKKGAFTAQAKKAGETVHEMAEDKKDAPGKTGKRARLALTFEKMRHKK